MKAWVRFAKKPRLRFISHLDLQRSFQRVLSRSALPIAYSNGFNPHPMISFGSALALGWTSEYEILELRLTEDICEEEITDRMSYALPEDLPVCQVRCFDDKKPAPMSLVKMSEYFIEMDRNGERICAALGEFLDRDSVMAVRKTKSGEREIDIRPLAIEINAVNEAIKARLMLTERDTLKPDVLIKAMAEIAGVECPRIKVNRLCLLGERKGGEMCPLMEL